MKKDWFEINEFRKRRFADAVWIPIRVSESIIDKGDYGELGYVHEFFGLGSLAVPLMKKDAAKQLSWGSIGVSHEHGVWAAKDFYKPADIYWLNENESLGFELALIQSFDGAEPRQWHLNQDLVFALGLLREGDIWVRPSEGYTQVARLRRNSKNEPVALEIKNEFLREYLFARNSFLKITWYRSRDMIVENIAEVGSPEAKEEKKENERLEIRVNQIIQGGWPEGKVAVFQSGRTDVDPDEDVPMPGPETDDNVESSNWEFEPTGKRFFRIEGELWRDEEIQPATVSPRIRRDPIPTGISYIVDASGLQKTSEELDDEDDARWLWFKPTVIAELLKQRGTILKWYTRETGGVGCGPGSLTHFGLNSSCLITVYAYDIAKLDSWQQRIWSGYNVTPEGKVSKELLSAQMQAVVAKTFAPENIFADLLGNLNKLFVTATGSPLLRDSTGIETLIVSINRFRALEPNGMFSLAKDIMRLIADRIDVVPLQKVAPPPKHEKWGSLKSLENYLGAIVGTEVSRKVMRTLFGLYQLRIADAHISAADLSDSFELAGVDPTLPLIDQGLILIDNAARAIWEIGHIVDEHVGSQTPQQWS
jgi:hypothetical protein